MRVYSLTDVGAVASTYDSNTSGDNQWQDPHATSYMALSLAAMAGGGIPPGFDIITGALYEKDTAGIYDKILSAK